MATPVLVTQAQLERRFGAQTIRDFADDTGDASSVSTNVAESLAEASARAIALLRPSWSTEQIQAMTSGADADPALIGAICEIAIAILARRRPAFLGPDGLSLYAQIERRAEERLREMARGNQRPDGERVQGAGANGQRFGIDPNREARALVFQGSRNNSRGPGGF